MTAQNALAQLHIVFPDGTESVVPVTASPFNIGRNPDNHLQLPDALISRYHARLLFEGDTVRLLDLGSSNGVLAGGARLTAYRPYALSFGEMFQVGAYTLRLDPAGMPVSAGPVSEPLPPLPPGPAPVEPAGPAQPGAILGAEPFPGLADEPAGGQEPVRGPQPGPPNGPLRETPSEPAPVGPSAAALAAIGQLIPFPELQQEPAPMAPQGPPYDARFGLPVDRSRYLHYLPPLFSDHPFLGRFLLAFEGILVPIEQIVDNFDLYLNPYTTPPEFLDHLAAWLGQSLDEKWPADKRRAVVAEAAELYRLRGTRRSLSRHVEIYTGVAPEIVEPQDKPHHFEVIVRLPAGQAIDRGTVERIIQANKPAHTTYALDIRIGDRRAG